MWVELEFYGNKILSRLIVNESQHYLSHEKTEDYLYV